MNVYVDKANFVKWVKGRAMTFQTAVPKTKNAQKILAEDLSNCRLPLVSYEKGGGILRHCCAKPTEWTVGPELLTVEPTVSELSTGGPTESKRQRCEAMEQGCRFISKPEAKQSKANFAFGLFWPPENPGKAKQSKVAIFQTRSKAKQSKLKQSKVETAKFLRKFWKKFKVWRWKTTRLYYI